MPYDEAGRLRRVLPGGGVVGGLGEVSGADACPVPFSRVPFCGLPSLTSPFLGACSSPAGAGLGRAIWRLRSDINDIFF